MKRGLIIALMLLATMPAKVKACEIYKAEATAYCLTGTTATGTKTVEGRTVASKPEWYGCTMIVWEDMGDGLIHPENYIGTYQVTDTGSEAIKQGKVIDVYISDYSRARKFGRKNVIFQIVESEG